MLISCCLCWKRKSTDVIPTHLEAEPFDPYKKIPIKRGLDGVKIVPPTVMVGSEFDKFSYTPDMVEEKEEAGT